MYGRAKTAGTRSSGIRFGVIAILVAVSTFALSIATDGVVLTALGGALACLMGLFAIIMSILRRNRASSWRYSLFGSTLGLGASIIGCYSVWSAIADVREAAARAD